MCKQMAYRSSFTSMIIDIFRASLIFVSLLSTSYVHFSILVIVSSFLSLNIMLIYKKITSNERLSENHEGIKHTKEAHLGDEDKVVDQSHITSLSVHPEEKEDNTVQPIVCDQVYEKGDTNGNQLGLISSVDIGSNLSLELGDELTSEDVEEDYLIDISLPEQEVLCLEEMKKHKLEIAFLDFVGGEEDSLIEIDISMGSISQSAAGSGCEIRT